MRPAFKNLEEDETNETDWFILLGDRFLNPGRVLFVKSKLYATLCEGVWLYEVIFAAFNLTLLIFLEVIDLLDILKLAGERMLLLNVELAGSVSLSREDMAFEVQN